MVCGRFWVIRSTSNIVWTSQMAYVAFRNMIKIDPFLAIFDPSVCRIRTGTASNESEVIHKLYKTIRIDSLTDLGLSDRKEPRKLMWIAKISHPGAPFEPKFGHFSSKWCVKKSILFVAIVYNLSEKRGNKKVYSLLGRTRQTLRLVFITFYATGGLTLFVHLENGRSNKTTCKIHVRFPGS